MQARISFPDDERMSAAEFRTITEFLGLSQVDTPAILGVNERTMRHWLSGRNLIPDRMRIRIEKIEAFTARAVSDVVDACMDIPDPTVLVYRTDEDMWAARLEFRPYPARWWRHVVARAAIEVPCLDDRLSVVRRLESPKDMPECAAFAGADDTAGRDADRAFLDVLGDAGDGGGGARCVP